MVRERVSSAVVEGLKPDGSLRRWMERAGVRWIIPSPKEKALSNSAAYLPALIATVAADVAAAVATHPLAVAAVIQVHSEAAAALNLDGDTGSSNLFSRAAVLTVKLAASAAVRLGAELVLRTVLVHGTASLLNRSKVTAYRSGNPDE